VALKLLDLSIDFIPVFLILIALIGRYFYYKFVFNNYMQSF